MSSGARLGGAATMAFVAALSLALLVYVGWSEAKRGYPRFVEERLAAEAEIIASAMAGHVRAGLPLGDFPGFGRIAEPIAAADRVISTITARDATGALVFSAGAAAAGAPAVSRPLMGRFEAAGRIEIHASEAEIAARTGAMLGPLAGLAAGLSLLLGVFAWVAAPKPGGGRRVVAAFAIIFTLAGGAVTASLVSLYAASVEERAKAVSDSLARRIGPVFAYGLTLEDVSGLDRLLSEYRRVNPDVAAVALIREGRVAAEGGGDGEARGVGALWRAPRGAYEYVSPLEGAGSVAVAVVLPAALVWRAVARSVRNFAALLLASGLFASVFFGVARSFETQDAAAPDRSLALMRPIFFLAVFADFLTAGFLPQMLERLAAEAGRPPGAASLAFTVYFAAFLLALMPASLAAGRFGARPLIVLGALVVAAASLIPVLRPEYAALVTARGMAGAGQGMLLIGVQGAVLAAAPPGGRARAAAVIVLGFNGGMIAGAAIGSLLVADIAAGGVFALAAASALFVAFYAFVAAPHGRPAASGGGLRALGRAVASGGFLTTLLFVGAPAKAALTGAVVFAAPLFLAGRGWAPEDIGQILMLYAAGVLAATGPAARFADREGRSGAALLLGGAGGALGVALIGAGEWAPAWGGAVSAGGVFLTGLAHGFVNAPVIAHVAASGAARAVGAPAATAIYRIAERGGHVAGPPLAGLALAASGGGGAAFLWFGAALMALTLLFTLSGVRTGAG